ncbi:Zinc finger, BED-type [Parasponia andersonii]|uniref:Zinc finger, BED-type n=1 Tax=Parasponia andersonii TaxID=3476 RepID=A0A2P5D422_PARAD|nr:Zinc finger, BED-type [Parasponia andersonii]
MSKEDCVDSSFEVEDGDLNELNEEDDDVKEVGSKSNTKVKKKTLNSRVWKFFDILPLGPNKKLRSKCKKCGQKYLASSKYGTSNIARHLKTCKRRDTRDIGQMLISHEKDLLSLSAGHFDSEKWHELVTSYIVMHDLPF